MKKIPTLFVRDEATNRKHVRNEVTPGCEWVLAGEGVATRKFDGTCVRFADGDWWFRREVKPGKNEPDGFVEVDYDEVTGKRVGWEPARPKSGFIGPLREAIDVSFTFGQQIPERTYELCGPKVQGNPEGLAGHHLIPHGEFDLEPPLDFDGLRVWLGEFDAEGIVWHHPDGRMAKLKKRDFPRDSGLEPEGPK